MDFLSRFLMINTVVLGVALALLAWNWRKTRSGNSRRKQNQPPIPHEYTNPGELEKRAKRAMSEANTFISRGEVNNKEKERFKAHQGAYYAHHYAANVHLMQESFNSYQAELNLAEQELIGMETVLHAHQPSLKSAHLAHSHS